MNRGFLLLSLALSNNMADILVDMDDGPYWRGILIAILGIGMGLGMILKPYAIWKFKFRWQLAYGEPTDAVLWSIRISGAVLLLVSVILLFIYLF